MEKEEESTFIIETNKLIEKGQYSNIYFAYKKNKPNKKYAAKLIPSSIINNQILLTQFSNEILITSQFKNKNLLHFISIEEDENGNSYIIMEYCNGNDLLTFIKKLKRTKKRNLNELEIQKILKDILYGLSCLHRNSIIHHDIKLENILLNFNTNEDLNNLNINNCTFKICDFGFSKFINNENNNYTIGGTIENIPPEIVLGRKHINDIDKSKIDIWAIGILAFKLMFSCHPFISEEDYIEGKVLEQLKKKLDIGKYKIILNENTQISKEFLWFIDSCLKGDFNKRLNSEDLEYSRFITRNVNNFNYINIQNIQNIPEKYLDNNINDSYNIINDGIIVLDIYDEKYVQDEIVE